MKPKSNPFLRSAALAASIVLTFGTAATAGTLYWDGNGTGASGNPPTTGVGGTGTWDLTNARWWNGTAYQTWNASGGLDVADFRVAGGTITVGTNTSANRLTFAGIASNNWVLATSGGAVLTLNNTGLPNITMSSAIAATGNQKVLISGKLAGTIYLGGSFTSASNTSNWVGIYGDNTGVTSTTIGEGTATVHRLGIASAAALGSAGATVSVSSNSQLYLDNTVSGTGVTFNAWDTTLAANSWLRVRNAGVTGPASPLTAGKSIYAGNIGLSGNAMISVRGSAGNALDLTGTVNTGVHTLTLASGDASNGIDLKNTLSGSGGILIAGNSSDGTTTGAGVVKLSADNSFAGTATTTIGTLALNHLNALDSATLDTGASLSTNSVTFTVAGTNTYNIGGLAGSDALAIGANTISLGAKAGSFSFGADISGGGGLTKTGSSSTQTLTAATSYSGATQVTGGTLALSGSGAINSSSGITINGSGAKLLHAGGTAISPTVTLTQGTLTGSGTVDTVNVSAGTGGIISNNDGVAGAALTIGTLTLSGGASINLYSDTTAAALVVTTLTNNSSANAVTITANNTGGWTNGSTYNLIGYSALGGSGGNNFAHNVNNLTARQSATWGDSGSAITLAIAGDNPRWMGDTDGKWNLSTANNWRLVSGGNYTTFLATDDVLFDDNATGTTTIDIDAADVAPNTTVFDNTTAKAYTLGSTGGYGISTGSLTKSNTGALTINNANSHTGGTTLNAGTLNIGNAGALGGVGNLFTINGGTIDNTSGGALTTNNQILSLNGDFAFTGSNDLNLGTGAATLGTAAGTSRAITVNGGKLTLANVLANGTTANSITKDGVGTLELTGANTLSGPSTINGGTLQISGGSAIANAALVTLGDVAGATFRVSGSETIGALTGGGATGGNVTLDAGQTLTLSSGTQTYAGTISGAGTLTSSGALQTLNGAISSSGGVNLTSGRLFLGGNSSYTGQTTVSTGAGIIITANNALGATGVGNETLLAGLGQTGGAVASAALGLSGGFTYSSNEKIIGAGIGNTAANGEFASVQRGLIQSVSGDNTFAGDIEINSIGFTRFGTQNGAQLTLSGTITAVSGATVLIRPGDTDGDFVTISGTGNSWDTDINIYSGNSNAAHSAGLRLGAHNALATGVGVIGATSSLAATTFDMAGFNQALNGLGNNGTLKISNSNGSQESTLTLNLTSADKGTANTRIVDGAGTIRLVKQGDFTQILAGNNNYTGTTTIEAGRILFGQVVSLYNGTSTNWTKENIIVNSGATLGLRVGGAGQFTTTDVATIVGNLTTGINNNGLQGGALLDLEVNATTTYSNVIADSTGTGSGSLGLVKTGTSGLLLDQDNTFTGGIAFNDGYLYAGHNNAFGSGSVTIGTGAERLAIQNGIDIGNDIVINGGGTSFNGLIQNYNAASGENATISGDITINANAAAGGHFASVGSGSTLTLTGSITSSVEVGQRTGTVIYSGGGSYTEFGITGTARLGANNGLATNATADLGVSGGGALDLAGYNQSLVGITKNTGGSATIRNTSTTADSTLTITGTSIYDGVIEDSTRKVNLTMNGAGETLTLTNTNTYAGDTTISAGTLALTGTGSIADSANLVVNGTLDVSGITADTFTVGSSQTLSGDGTINATGKTLSIAGTHAVGSSPGQQDVIGDVSYASGSVFEWDLNANAETGRGTVYDAVDVDGTLTVDSDAIFKIVLGAGVTADPFWTDPNVSRTWSDIFSFTSLVGSFETAKIQVTGPGAANTGMGSFTITGTTLTWTAVPEPTSALVGLLIGAGLLRRRRVA